MFENFIEIKGQENGPISIILAGVHGNERCGVEALKKILPDLVIGRGTVFFGRGNPRALKVGKRFIAVNLNRLFRRDDELSNADKAGYEYRRAKVIRNYLDRADALLDIHASSIPNTKPFAVSEPEAGKIVKYLPAKIFVSGFDKVEFGGTDYYMNQAGKIGICLECGYLGDPQSTKIAEDSIFAFLKARGHLTNDLIPRRQSRVEMYQKYFTKTDNFVLAKSFGNFETVDKNQLIGTDGREEVRAPKRSLILFAHDCQEVNSEAFLLGTKLEDPKR
jgi:succinylglutamate desuccinylase